ncbi:PAS domain S-box protein [Dehalogenimonas alkenigignens]|uniref:PAS domain S-box protein n=1 Tax=Dehalogenimonas alkenigignens TaxID=1217799 RepID=UPI000D565E0D|nr:PAS domain S-box protein [Dehalogenimonas alkenigignens]PVV84446.1 hypothetical protein DD509_03905 [Dehalogenimonas alkenigignens]
MTVSKQKILLVTPLAADAREVNDLLARFGGERFIIESVSQIETALEMIENGAHLDLLIFDAAIADGAALDIVRAAVRRAPQVPLVVLSGESGGAIAAEYLRAGAGEVAALKDGGASLVQALDAAFERHRKEQSLRQAQRRLEAMGEVLGFGRWEILLDEMKVVASESARIIYGLEGTEWTLSQVQAVPLLEYRAMLDRALSELISGGQLYNVEFRIRRPNDGQTAWVQSVAEYDAAGRRVLGIIKDITQAKNAEEALRESEHRYRLLAEKSTDVIWTMSFDGRFTYVSPSVYQLRGFTPEEVMRQSIEEAVCPDSAVVVRQGLAQAIAAAATARTLGPAYLEIEQPRKDGGTVWTEVSVSVVKDEGRPSHILGVTRDITERRRIQAELKEREAELAAIFMAEPVGIVVSVDRVIWEVNDAACNMCGYQREELVGHSSRILYSSDADYRRLGDELYAGLESAGRVTLEMPVRRKDGSVFQAVVSGAVLERTDLSRGIVFAIQDITERKLFETSLKEREAKLAAIFRAAPVGIAVAVGRVIVEANDTMYQMAGYSREDFIGRSTRILYDSDAEYEKVGAELYSRLQANGHMTGEITGRRRDGSHFPMLLSASPLDMGDLSRGIVFTAMDISERKAAEEAIRLSEQKYRLLFNSSNDAVLFHDEQGRFIEVNDRACQILGYRRDELLGMTVADIDDPAVILDSGVVEQMAACGSVVFEQVHVAKDGRRIPVEISSRQIQLGGRQMVLSVARDITERKKAEAELRRSMSLLAATLEATADGILVVGLDGKVQRYSSRFAKMWGIPKSLLAKGDDNALLDNVLSQLAEPQQFLDKVHELYAHPSRSSFDTLLFKDGRVFERYSRPQKIGEQIVGRVWSFRDVTQHQTMEDRLLRAAEEWRATFDAISTPVSIQDRDFKILRVNKAYAESLNTTAEELIGKTCFEVSHGTGEPVENCPHLRTLDSGQPAEVEIHNAAKGTYTVVSTYPMFGPAGEVVATVHIAQDITERKKMQEKLMVTNRLASVGELAAGIAHEINNPLTGVLGFSELALSADLPQSVRADIEVIHSEARRAADVVKNLLIFARRHQQARAPLSINDVISRTLALRAYEQKIHNIEMITDLEQELPEITADYFQLQQVFLNIIINAEFFMIQTHNRGRLVVTTRFLPGERVIRVSFADDGPGIPADVLPRLFDPFFTTKEVGQGTGLGLSISHGVVQSHGGRIWAESQQGAGATFFIDLPLRPPESSPEQAGIIV